MGMVINGCPTLIAGLQNWLYLIKELMELTGFWCVDINSGKLEVGLSSFKIFCFICLIESPLKVMKNAFYFISKALLVLKIFKFLS